MMADLTTIDIVGASAGVGGAGTLVWALVRWSLNRNLAKDDAANQARDARLVTHDAELRKLEGRLERFEARSDAQNRDIGRLESENGRLNGKIEGLQSDWRGKFEKLQEELRLRDERLVDMIHDAKSDNAKGIADLRSFLEEYRAASHDRLNEITRLIIQQSEEIERK